MRIAIINKYQFKVNRGAETYVVELAKRLSVKHEVDILTKINLHKKYDVVIPTNGRLQVFIVRLFTWLTGAKMVVSGQSGTGLDDRLNLYAFPDAFVALSSKAREASVKRNPFVRSVYIPNGVDLSKFNPIKSNNKVKTVISISAFTKEKRNDLTIKAVSKLKDVKLVIVGGGGELKQDVLNLGQKILGKDRFEVLSVDHSEISKILNKADLLAFPTVPWESFGIVLVEAMAANLPIVATDDPIRREIVGDAGLFVDPTDTDAYAKALEKALNTNWGVKPRKQAEKFDWDKIANQYEELFKKL